MVRRSIIALVLVVSAALGACTNPSGGGSTAAPAASVAPAASAAPAASEAPYKPEPGY